MLTTPNYALKKIELADSPPDITVLNFNWDTIDTKLKEIIDAAGLSQQYKLTLSSGLPIGYPTNCNAAIETGLYSISGTPANAPSGMAYGSLLVLRRSASDIIQIANGTNQAMWYRNSANNGVAWNPWRMIATTDTAQMFKLTSDIGLAKWNSANLNSEVYSGMYNIVPTTLNVPKTNWYGICTTTRYDNNLIIQNVVMVGDNYPWYRSSTDAGATWTAWNAPVIVESGSNANGRYIKFGDGTMICHIKKSFVANSGGYLDILTTYPASCINSPTITTTIEAGASGEFQGAAGIRYVYSTACNIICYNLVPGNAYIVNVTVIERWKA